jgi:hypothetical protein
MGTAIWRASTVLAWKDWANLSRLGFVEEAIDHRFRGLGTAPVDEKFSSDAAGNMRNRVTSCIEAWFPHGQNAFI